MIPGHLPNENELDLNIKTLHNKKIKNVKTTCYKIYNIKQGKMHSFPSISVIFFLVWTINCDVQELRLVRIQLC